MIEDEQLVTIETWAGDELGITPTDEQINNLIDALSVCGEAYYTSGAFSGGETEEEKEIKKLKKQIRGLENFISSKGLSVYVGETYIEESWFDRISSSHVASNSERHYF